MENLIYADNAATTKIDKSVTDVMLPYILEHYGNPSSFHTHGQKIRVAVEDARTTCAKLLGASDAREITFTSGGTEANNLAIKGFMNSKQRRGNHIITTKFEHPAVLEPCKYLAKNGYEVTYLDVDIDGLISLDDLKNAIRPDTALVTIMSANNEIGTILPVAEIGAICKEHGVKFHTDAVQAIGHIDVNVADMNVDMLSISGHKIHGPKGSGILYVKRGIMLNPLIHGGGQENKRRSGTENVANIIGTTKALELAITNKDAHMSYVDGLRKRLTDGIMQIPKTRLTGHPVKRLPGTASFVFEAIEGEGLLMLLDMHGICASTGSACASGSLDPSHVLMAIGLPHEIAHGSLRLSLSHENTEEEIDFIIDKVAEAVARLREMSPIWNG